MTHSSDALTSDSGQRNEFLKRVLEPPFYGWADPQGVLVHPSTLDLLKQFRTRMSFWLDRRNWLTSLSWTMAALLLIPLFFFVRDYWSWPLLAAGAVYSMVFMGTHGTIYLHRYGSHRAYRFSHRLWVEICRNLVIKIIPEEIYIVSHAVHHRYTELPGDPYNVHGGFLYCFLADANHQLISRSLSREDYERVRKMVAHTGMKTLSYEGYQRWGSLAHPGRTVAHYLLNWAFWYGAFFLIGGQALATAIFGLAAFWAFGVRTFNYDGHGRGKDKRQDGVDFHRGDLSVNQLWPGFVASEWHNNHHLYPNSARCGFLSYQIDMAWMVIRTWELLGIVNHVRNDHAKFSQEFGAPGIVPMETPISQASP
jgi:fatty-acid desaturase